MAADATPHQVRRDGGARGAAASRPGDARRGDEPRIPQPATAAAAAARPKWPARALEARARQTCGRALEGECPKEEAEGDEFEALP